MSTYLNGDILIPKINDSSIKAFYGVDMGSVFWNQYYAKELFRIKQIDDNYGIFVIETSTGNYKNFSRATHELSKVFDKYDGLT